MAIDAEQGKVTISEPPFNQFMNMQIEHCKGGGNNNKGQIQNQKGGNDNQLKGGIQQGPNTQQQMKGFPPDLNLSQFKGMKRPMFMPNPNQNHPNQNVKAVKFHCHHVTVFLHRVRSQPCATSPPCWPEAAFLHHAVSQHFSIGVAPCPGVATVMVNNWEY